MFKRSVENILKEALKISPAVLLVGARQVGKSTLCLSLDREYRVFDDLTQREAAKHDPQGYIASLPKPITIDEIQKVPEVLEGIKLFIDKNRVNGSFLLTGSANGLDMKKTKDTFGLMHPLPIDKNYPGIELNNKPTQNVVDMLFERDFSCERVDSDVIEESIISGGYPEILKLDSELKRRLWFSSYISTYIERDARELGEIREINNFFKFFNVIAPRTATLLNKSKITKATALKDSLVDNFLTILAQLYQVELVRPYSENIGKQFVKSPKLHMIDTGIACHLLRIKNAKTLDESHYKGQIYESFVFSELKKHISFAVDNTDIFHYHTSDKKEIDFILSRGEQMLAIEVKASHSVDKGDFKHIFDFQNSSKKDILGIVFYMGDRVLEIDERNFAIPFGMFF